MSLKISNEKYRNGFITKNKEVQQQDFNLVARTYGANNFGEKGVARHNVLNSMFNMPEDFTDYNISISSLSGRGQLESGPDQNLNTFQSNIIQGQTSFNAENFTESDVRSAQNNLIAGREDFEEITADETQLEGAAFNPDFPDGSVNFFYSDKSNEINRSKDGIELGTLAPNALFASKGFDNPETETEYLSPLKGSGGFGNNALENKVSPFAGETLNTILSRYQED